MYNKDTLSEEPIIELIDESTIKINSYQFTILINKLVSQILSNIKTYVLSIITKI